MGVNLKNAAECLNTSERIPTEAISACGHTPSIKARGTFFSHGGNLADAALCAVLGSVLFLGAIVTSALARRAREIHLKTL